jgi:cardiolipin synthase
MFWLGWLYLFNVLLMIIIAIREVRRPVTALTWLMVSLIIPIIGFMIYLSTSRPMQMKEIKQRSAIDSDPLPATFSQTAITIAHSLRQISVNGLKKSKVRLLINGIETYESLMKSIENAQKTIELEYYIFRNDHIGEAIINLLMERSISDIQVRFMIDGWGSRKLPKSVIRKLMDAGVECRTFYPLRFPWSVTNWNYRNHCKNVIIDEREAFTGGINIGDEYSGKKPDIGFWRDTHVRIVGEAVEDITMVYNTHWEIASKEPNNKTGKKNNIDKEKLVKETDKSKASLTRWSAEWAAELGTIDTSHQDDQSGYEAYTQTFEGNPGIPTQAIREAYFVCITQANHTIDISTPYFLPDVAIMMALKTAVSRGVRVRLLVPREVDSMLVELASQTFYGELLDAGVQIYLYNKGVMHAKQMIIDDDIVLLGAANYDMRSFRLNLELCEIFYSSELTAQLHRQYEEDIENSVLLHTEELAQRSKIQRIKEQGARVFLPLL